MESKSKPDNSAKDDEYWMQQALLQAKKAYELNEVPVGAVVVGDSGELLGLGWNQPITGHDPTAHAEIQALRSACEQVGNYRLPGATLYVTLEPCVMCVGALVHGRISRLVFGAYEPKAGAVCSRNNLLDAHNFNWHIDWTGGVLQAQCSELISGFFQLRRDQVRADRAANKKD